MSTVKSGLAYASEEYLDVMSQALVKKAVMPALCRGFNIPAKTDIFTVSRDGSLTSSTAAVTEGANYTTLSQYQTAKVQVSVVKEVVSSFVTVEASDLIGASPAVLAEKQGQALARRWDTALSALFTNISTTAGTTNTDLTKDKLMDAVYNVIANSNGAVGNLVAVLSLKQELNLKKEMTSTTAVVFGLPIFLSMLGTPGTDNSAPNGLIGQMPGVTCFRAFNLPTANAAVDDVGCVFDPAITFATAANSAPRTMVIERGVGNPSFGFEVSSYLFHGEAEWNDLTASRIISKA